MAIKYLDAKRIRGTGTEKDAMSVIAPRTTVGYDGTSTGNISYITYRRVGGLTEDDEITSVGVRIKTATDVNFKMGVYDDNGGNDGTSGTSRPDQLMADGDAWGETTGITTSTELWVDTVLNEPAVVPASGKVWVAYIQNDTTGEFRNTSGVTANIGHSDTATGVYGTGCTPSGVAADYGDMFHQTANYGNSGTQGGDQIAGHIWNVRVQIGTSAYPNLPAGTIFEQTNDYKYYIWDGTDTWTVMVAN